jgi:hypothetical protein
MTNYKASKWTISVHDLFKTQSKKLVTKLSELTHKQPTFWEKACDFVVT